MPTGGFSFEMLNYFSDYGRSRGGRRERITYNKQQLDQLEAVFKNTRYPDLYKREELSKFLGIPEVRIQVWFKNRRARQRQNERTTNIIKNHHNHQNSTESPPPPPPTNTTTNEQNVPDDFKIIKPDFEMIKPELPEMNLEQKSAPFVHPQQNYQNYQNYSNPMSWWQANWQYPPYYPYPTMNPQSNVPFNQPVYPKQFYPNS
uniref:Homeobox domain-containing protein n=1 Tax=Panagrolaimus sp. JU765 TaxID=591449 RepID=A0AC34QCW9_9BILA